MKICRIVYEMPPPWDGLAPHPYEISVAQSKKGYEITIFCGRWPKAGPVEKISNVKYIHVWREPFPATISFTSSVVLFFKYLNWRRNNRPDILHCHGHFAIWIYLYRLILVKLFPWAEELKIPMVVHFHNTAQGRWDSFNKEGKYIAPHSKYIQWPLSVFSDKLATQTAAACIFVSQDTKEEAIKFYNADPRRCFVVETGVNTELFVPVNQQEKDKSRKEMNLDVYDKVVLNLGAMVERKNIQALVESMVKLPSNYKLILVGNWDGSYQQKVLEKIGRMALGDRVIRLGYTPYPLNPIAYQIADVFVLPSTWEGLPKAVMQSLACGIPAIVSGFRLQDEVSGIFYLENTEPATIAAKIQEVVESKPRVDVRKIYIEYSWDVKIKEIDKVYEFAAKNNIL